MTLVAGAKLGPYEVLSPLGAGGMGEVYRARDTRLGRDVALKVIPDAMAHDAERMARFQREAQVLASLNHPNIASIHGLEESGGVRALVMEFVDGATLAELLEKTKFENRNSKIETGNSKFESRSSKIENGRAKIENGKSAPSFEFRVSDFEPLPVARQIAEALEYAHEHGIIHRDLKPANIKITPEGTVKVLDFGLAKALGGDASGLSDVSNSPTLTAAATQAGIILGTAAYMSPEQARGKAADRRADIWSFGCVLFEMLTGKRLFEGETVTDVLAAVVRAEPDWNTLPAGTPPRVCDLLRRCLIKDPRQRLRDIGEARIAIEETISGVAPGFSPAQEDAALKGGATAGEPRSPRKRALPWVAATVLIAIAAIGGWWVGTRNSPAAAEWSGGLLPGPTIAFWPRVSPDGRLVAFQTLIDNMSQVAVMDPESGNWSVLTHDRTHGLVASLAWSPDGSTIYFDRLTSQPLGVYTVPTLGGEAREVLGNAATPEPLPDGSLLLVRVDPDRRSQVYHFWPDTGKQQALGAWVTLSPAAPLRVFPDGKEAIFFGTAKDTGADNSPHLYLLDISSGTSKRLAPDLPIIQTAQMFPLAASPDGKSVLIDLPSGSLHRIVAIPRTGASQARTLMSLTSGVWSLDAARDGSLYVDQVDRPLQVLRFPASGGTPEVLDSLESYPVSAGNAAPVEFPDGRFLFPATISGRSRLLLGQPGGNFVPLLQTNEATEPPVVRVGDADVALMVGSGSKQALTLASVKEGRILRRFDDTEGKPITALAASPDGKTLFYVTSGSVWSVPSEGGNSRKLGAGDGVVTDANGRDLLVDLIEPQHVRLQRVPLAGGPAQEITVKSDAPITPLPLGPEAINPAGKMLIGVVPNDSWFFRMGILDLSSGAVTMIPLNYAGDTMVSSWSSDGRVLTTATPIRAHIWHFKPATGENK